MPRAINIGFYIAMVLLAIMVIGVVVSLLPQWAINPMGEATTRQYIDASEVPTTTDAFSTKKGRCPAMTMDVAKALADNKLTNLEAHELAVRADFLSKESIKVWAKNQATVAVGGKPTADTIDCDDGLYLFKY